MSWSLLTVSDTLTRYTPPCSLSSNLRVCSMSLPQGLCMGCALFSFPGMHAAHSLIIFKSCSNVTFSLITALQVAAPVAFPAPHPASLSPAWHSSLSIVDMFTTLLCEFAPLCVPLPSPVGCKLHQAGLSLFCSLLCLWCLGQCLHVAGAQEVSVESVTNVE